MGKFSTTSQKLLLAALILLGIHILVSFFSVVLNPKCYSRVLWTISFLDVAAAFVLIILACYYEMKDDDDNESYISEEKNEKEPEGINSENFNYQDAQGNNIQEAPSS
ncbi:MAG: hypothetical protein CMM15_03810 [Rhodospirillaceae bacterium]|nr:hypothetical protein [Rhodospirillaceae bacterium]|tara:strand:+ start:797 stop:1120 length:324 start_codon:yes stop_codon:yes gene_type:complete